MEEENAKVFEGDDFIIFPLYSKLSEEGQGGVFSKYENKRKIVVATNVAETSLTIDGLVYLVDSGRFKEKQTDHLTGL